MGGKTSPFRYCYQDDMGGFHYPLIWDEDYNWWYGGESEQTWSKIWYTGSTWVLDQMRPYQTVPYRYAFDHLTNGIDGCDGLDFASGAQVGICYHFESDSMSSYSSSSSYVVNWSSTSSASSESSSSSYIANWSSSSIDSSSSSSDLECPDCMTDYECSTMPAMTNNSSPSPYVASDRDSTANAYKPFNRNKSDYLEFTDIGGAYFQIDFGAGNSRNIKHIALTIDTAITAPTSLLVIGTNDLVNYDSIANLAYSDWTDNQTKCWINIPNVNSHRYVQFSVSTAASSTARIVEIVMAEDHIMSSSERNYHMLYFR